MNGLDLYALGHPKFPWEEVLEEIPEGWSVGAFDCEDTFGRSLKRIRSMYKRKRLASPRLHAHWHKDHLICPLNKLRAKLPEYQDFALELGSMGNKLFLSHSCEYRSKDVGEIQKRVDLIHRLAPACVAVNSPEGGSAEAGRGVLFESHGAKASPRANIVSTDGMAAYDMDIARWLKRTHSSVPQFLWGLRFNMRENPHPPETVPAYKLRNAIPSPEYIRSVVALASNPGTPPAPGFQGRVFPIRKPMLWKTHAEDSQEKDPLAHDDPRENKPCLIIPVKADYCFVVTKDGAPIDHLPYWGGYGPKLFRYYAGLAGSGKKWGYELSNEATELSGSPFIWFKPNGHDQYFGPVHGAFRAGYFQEEK